MSAVPTRCPQSHPESQSLSWAGTLLARALAETLGTPVAIACFALVLLPYTVANRLIRNLEVLRIPVGQVSELGDRV